MTIDSIIVVTTNPAYSSSFIEKEITKPKPVLNAIAIIIKPISANASISTSNKNSILFVTL